MEKIEKYLLIAFALAALFFLSYMNRGSGKNKACCPFSMKQGIDQDKARE
ncbi:MAG TPA: hypothetical protein PK107_05010 [Candidatus Omnitrophota bacterium]|nr:hypothetical protein [Candidatus Omnitrophota bacterium]HQO38161.1 hypothetical protein [Candidatus Omnitrophota bacterium]